jgi:predicted RNA binding protein YcfA (HicA-like mRNA interferase family)
MSPWPSTRARRVLSALLRIGWTIKRQSGSCRTLSALVGLTLSLPSTTMRSLVLGCLLELLSERD